jgi:hypothetical protein
MRDAWSAGATGRVGERFDYVIGGDGRGTPLVPRF